MDQAKNGKEGRVSSEKKARLTLLLNKIQRVTNIIVRSIPGKKKL